MEIEGSTSSESKSKRSVLIPWVEKFRPKSVADIVSQDSIVAAMKKFLETENV